MNHHVNRLVVRAVLGAALFWVASLVAPVFAQALPPSNAAPTVVWTEDFSAGTTPVALDRYGVGAYTAASDWLPGQTWCNGWVLSATNNITKAQDAGCVADGGIVNNNASNSGGNATALNFLRAMAAALNTSDGDPVAVASMTNAPNPTNQTDRIQLQTTGIPPNTPYPAWIPGHFYVLTTQFAEVHCSTDANSPSAWNNRDANETLTLNGNESAALKPCSVGTATTASIVNNDGKSFSTPVHVANLSSGAWQATSATDPISFQIQNATTATTANDVAFNLLQIKDATPQLYKWFGPSSSSDNYMIGTGGTTNLTFEIANTTDYQAKDGWSFTDDLPSGVTLTGTAPAISGGCTAGIVATAGSSRVTVTNGTLPAGVASCTLTVEVTSSVNGTYPNAPGTNVNNVVGLLDPNTATLSVASIALNKTGVVTDSSDTNVLPGAMQAGDIITYTFTITNEQNFNVTDITIDDSLLNNAGTAINCDGTGTVLAGGTLTCTAKYTVTTNDITNAAANGGTIINTATATGTAANTGQPETTPNAIATTPVYSPALTVTKGIVSGALVADGQINYGFTVKNTGNVPLESIAIDDNATTGFTGAGGMPTVVCQETTLAAGASTSCTAIYTVETADITAGEISNDAQATANLPLTLGGVQYQKSTETSVSALSNTVNIKASSTGGGVLAVPTLEWWGLGVLAVLLGGVGGWTQRRRKS